MLLVTKLSNKYKKLKVKNNKMRQHINNNKLSFVFIFYVTCFSISLMLNNFYNIISDKKISLFNLVS